MIFISKDIPSQKTTMMIKQMQQCFFTQKLYDNNEKLSTPGPWTWAFSDKEQVYHKNVCMIYH